MTGVVKSTNDKVDPSRFLDSPKTSRRRSTIAVYLTEVSGDVAAYSALLSSGGFGSTVNP